jgi:hypothetical protein
MRRRRYVMGTLVALVALATGLVAAGAMPGAPHRDDHGTTNTTAAQVLAAHATDAPTVGADDQDEITGTVGGDEGDDLTGTIGSGKGAAVSQLAHSTPAPDKGPTICAFASDGQCHAGQPVTPTVTAGPEPHSTEGADHRAGHRHR